LNKLLKIVAVACIAIILATSALILFQPQRIISEKDFPLEVDLSKTSFSPTIMNRSGKDVNVSSNGEMPCVFFHEVNDTITHGETTERVDQILKENEKMSRVFEFEATEPGTYILYVHYRIEVNNIAIQDKIDDIIIEVR
jgi:hypothetical protein